MKNTIQETYQGSPIRFNRDGWINATTVPIIYGKRVGQWLSTLGAQRYLAELATAMELHSNEDLIQVHKGRMGGTWLHPRLAIEFARWLDPNFAIWCMLVMERILRDELTEKLRYELAFWRLADHQKIASKHGKELAKWRWSKAGLQYEVAHWKEQMQLNLGLDSPS